MQDAISLQNEIVLAITQAVNDKWHRVVVHIEAEDIDGEETIDCLAVYFRKSLFRFKRNSFLLPHECHGLFRQLCKQNQSPWSGCLIEIDPDGRYRFSYAYDKPKRLYGDFSDAAQLKSYDPKAALP